MKWADAKTRLSFVTATLNSLWAATPPSFQQHHVDGGAGQVRGGAGVQRVGLVPELSVEGGDRVPTRRRAHAAGVHHGTGAPLHRDRRFRAELAGDVGIGRRRGGPGGWARPAGRRAGGAAGAVPAGAGPAPAGRGAAPGRDSYWTAPSGRWLRRRRESWPQAIAGPPPRGPGRSPQRSRGNPRT